MFKPTLVILACMLLGCGATPDASNAGSPVKIQSCAATYTCRLHATSQSSGDLDNTKTVDVEDKNGDCVLTELNVSYSKDGSVKVAGSDVPYLHWSGNHQAFTISGSTDAGSVDIECTWLHDPPPPEPTVTCVEYYTYDNICSSTTGGHHESVRCDDNVPISDCKSRNNDNVDEYCSTFMSWRDEAFSQSCADLGYEAGVSKDL